jgi:hypothetical protein
MTQEDNEDDEIIFECAIIDGEKLLEVPSNSIKVNGEKGIMFINLDSDDEKETGL